MTERFQKGLLAIPLPRFVWVNLILIRPLAIGPHSRQKLSLRDDACPLREMAIEGGIRPHPVAGHVEFALVRKPENATPDGMRSTSCRTLRHRRGARRVPAATRRPAGIAANSNDPVGNCRLPFAGHR